MEFIEVTSENLETEHICCAISNNNDCQVIAKKSWLADRFTDGLVFYKLNARGKCFIEYIPADKAWVPIDADGYMYIDCLWVSGQFKGQGYSSTLMEKCITDSKSKGMKGIVVLSSKKKQAFLSDPKYLVHRGFSVVDSAEPYYDLYCLRFDDGTKIPQFMPQVKKPHIDENGFVLYYSHQCPFTAKYVPIINKIADEHSVPFKAIRFETAQQAKNAPAPFTAYSLFYDGEFVTNEIMSEKKFEKLIAEKGY